MKAVSIVGYKKSGKTSLIIELIKYFKNLGLKVFILKNSHSAFDKKDNDTSKFFEYADCVAGQNDFESFINFKGKKDLTFLLSLYEADIILIEGGKSQYDFIPRIILGNNMENIVDLQPALAICTYGGETINDIPKIYKIDDLGELILEKAFLLPNLNCKKCGKKGCKQMAIDIINGKASIENCQFVNSDLKLSINGVSIKLNDFVSKTFLAVMKALISQLKGDVGGNVQIEFENV